MATTSAHSHSERGVDGFVIVSRSVPEADPYIVLALYRPTVPCIQTDDGAIVAR